MYRAFCAENHRDHFLLISAQVAPRQLIPDSSAQISVSHLFAGFQRTLRLDNASQFEESITVTPPDRVRPA